MDLQIPGVTDIDSTSPESLQSPTAITGGEFGGAPAPMDVTKLSKSELMNILSQAQALNLDPRSMIGAKFILSVVPWPLQHGPFDHGGQRRYYSIPGVKKGDHFVLPIFNTYITIGDNSRSEEEIISNGGRPFFVQRPVLAQQFCDDLIKHWAGDHPANKDGGQLGLLQIRSKSPTPEELQIVTAMQAKFFRNLCSQAHKFHISGQPQHIHFEHYRAAEYLGLSNKEHPWIIAQTNADPTINCIACKEPMNHEAYRCSKCGADNAQEFFDMQLAADKVTMPGIARRLKYLIDDYNKKNYIKSASRDSSAAPVAPVTTTGTGIGTGHGMGLKK